VEQTLRLWRSKLRACHAVRGEPLRQPSFLTKRSGLFDVVEGSDRPKLLPVQTLPFSAWQAIISAMKKNSSILSDPTILSGTPVFAGTRVPVKTLIDSLEAGDSIDLFLSDFPSVARSQIVAFLEMTKETLLTTA